ARRANGLPDAVRCALWGLGMNSPSISFGASGTIWEQSCQSPDRKALKTGPSGRSVVFPTNHRLPISATQSQIHPSPVPQPGPTCSIRMTILPLSSAFQRSSPTGSPDLRAIPPEDQELLDAYSRAVIDVVDR